MFKYCFSSTFPQVKYMVLKNSGALEDAEDIFQDALIIFYRNVIKEEFELTSSISTYVYAISHNLWLKQLRKRKKNAIDLQEADVALIEDFEFELAEEKADKLSDVLAVMETVGKRCKEILTLYYFKKLKYDFIAEKLGMKDERAVREQKYRCMKRIKELLNP